MSLGQESILETERGSTRSHCVENWLWNGLWTFCKTGHGLNEYVRSDMVWNVNEIQALRGMCRPSKFDMDMEWES